MAWPPLFAHRRTPEPSAERRVGKLLSPRAVSSRVFRHTLGVSERLERATGPGGYLATGIGQTPSVAGLPGAPLVHGSLEFRLHVDVADPVQDLVTVDTELGQEVVELPR